MLIPKSFLKKISKKSLSLFLALLMIMSSMSVCFGEISIKAAAANSDVTAFYTVAKSYIDKYGAFPTLSDNSATGIKREVTDNGKTGKSKVITKTWSYKPDTYAKYELFCNVIKALHKAAFSLDEYKNCRTHKNNNPCADGYFYSSSQENGCTDWGYVKDALKADLGGYYTTLQSGKIDILLDAVLNYDEVPVGTNDKAIARPSNGTNNDFGNSSKDSDLPSHIWNDFVLYAPSNSAAEIISSAKTVDELPGSYYGSYYFRLGLARAAVFKMEKNCDTGKYEPTSTKYYHMAIQDPDPSTNLSNAAYTVAPEGRDETAIPEKSTLTATQNTFNSYSKYFEATGKKDVLAISSDAATLKTVKTNIETARKNVVDKHGETIYLKFFPTATYNVGTTVKYIEEALTFLGFQAIVSELDRLCAIEYEGMTKAEAATLLSSLNTAYGKYDGESDSNKQDILNEYPNFKPAAVEARIAEVRRYWELADIREAKASIDEHILAFEGKWTIEDVDNDYLNGATAGAAFAIVEADYNQLKSMDKANVIEVCGDGYFERVEELYKHLSTLATAADYNDVYTPAYKEFYRTIKYQVPSEDTDTLLAALQNYDNWYAQVRTAIDGISTGLSAEIAEMLFDEVKDDMLNYMDNAYAVLNGRVETQINLAYVLYTDYTAVNGEAIYMASVSDYRTLKATIGLIDTDAYNFLNGSPNFTVSQDAVNKYNTLMAVDYNLEEFIASHGFSSYKQTEIPDIVRPDTEKDIVRENPGDKYTVTDEKVLAIITKLEAILAEPTVQKLLGDLINKDKVTGEPTGEPFKLGALVEGLLEDVVYTDSLINTIVQYVYPLVAKEFAKVWAGLPASLTIKDIDTGFLGIKADVTATLSLYTVEDAIAAVGVFLAPGTLAKNLENAYGKNSGEYKQYTDVISVLKSVTTKAVYNKNGDGDEDDTFQNPWEDAKLFENVYDEVTGEQVFNDDGTPKQVYKLNWGVDEAEDKKAAFINAACAALSGLEPLLFALLTNRTQANANDSDGTPRGHKIGTGSGKADVGIKLNLEIDPITLVLKFGGNDGYDNALAPIFEALGLTNIPHGEDLTTTRKILENGLFGMIDQLIRRLNTDPLTFLLNALPNLAYAIEGDLVAPLLNMLKTEINYYADAKYSVIGIVNGEMPDAMKSEEPININLGEMINLADMGLDISSFQAIWNMIAGGVKLLAGVPAPNAGKLATMGKLVEKSTNRSQKTYEYGTAGKAYHIDANKADVLVYLLQYALGSGLLGGIVENPEGLIADLLANLSKADNADNIIAAIAEVLTLGKYNTFESYTWFNSNDYTVGTVTGFNPATEIYLSSNNDWTEAKADYLYANLETVINSVIAMLPEKEEAPAAGDENAPETVADGEEATEGEGEAVVAAKTLSTILGDLIGGLYSDATLTSLAALLAKLDLNELLAGDKTEAEAGEGEGEGEGEDTNEPSTAAEGEEGEDGEEAETPAAPAIDVNALVKDLLGIDLAAIAADYADIAAAVEATKNLPAEQKYVDHRFGVDDAEDKKEAFVAALAEMLEPFEVLLAFLFAGEDIEIFDGKAQITLPGYEGYNTAIIPLLEALGCTPAAIDEKDGTGIGALVAVLDALIARIDALVTNPVDEIFNVLAGLIYFLASNGLSVTVRNLLQPAYVVLDTIRPIIDLDLDKLIGDALKKATKNEEFFFSMSTLNANFVVDLVSGLTGLNLSGLKKIFYDVAKNFTVVDYTEKPASTLDSTFKTATYSTNFSQADLLTVLLSYVLEWVTVEENAEALDTLIKKEGIGEAIANIIKGVEFAYSTPNWMYFFETQEAFDAYIASGAGLPNTLKSLSYANNWNEKTAEYLAENLGDIVDLVIGMVSEEDSLADLLNGLINENINADTLNSLIGMIAGLLESVDENLLAFADYLLSGDNGAIDIEGLKNYKCTKQINGLGDFINELANVLDTYAGRLVNWLFFGKDFKFAKKSNNTDSLIIKGGLGYETGLALLLEALGCELPATADTKSVLGALAARVNEILADPVNEIIDLLPNLIYFLNANGVGVVVGNLLAPVNALLKEVNAFLEKPISIADLIKIKIYAKDEEGNVLKDEEGKDIVEKEIALNLEALSLANVVELLKELLPDFDYSAVENYLVNFCTGKIEKGTYIYKMTAPKADVVTIILTLALEFVKSGNNGKVIDEMIPGDASIVSALDEVFASALVQYMEPKWYGIDWDNADYEANTAPAIKSALTYANDWTAEESLFLAANLDEIVDAVIGMIEINGVKYDSLAALLEELVDLNELLYTPALFETIQNALGGLLNGFEGDIKTIIDDYGYTLVKGLLDADIAALLAYDASGVNDKASFIEALTDMLMTVEGLVEWLLFGEDYAFFMDKEGKDIITLNGAEGYAQGLSLLLEALGVENLPAADGETRAVISGVLTAVFNRVEEILADPVNEVLDLLPNVIYFINNNGLAAAVNNLAGAFNALALKLKAFGLNITLADLVNLEKLLKIYKKNDAGETLLDEEGKPIVKDLAISVDNLTLDAVLELVGELTGLKLNGVAAIFGAQFALGQIEGYTGVNGKLNGRMAYATLQDKADMITLLVTAVLRAFETKGNDVALAALIGENGEAIVAAIKAILADTPIENYAAPNWNYMKNSTATEDGYVYDNVIVAYPNDWTVEKAKYISDNLAGIVNTVISMIEINGQKYENLGALLADVLAEENVFSSANLQIIVDKLAELLGGIDDGLLEAAGLLLNVNVAGLEAYTAPANITTVDAFAAELANILNTYALGVVEWLLLGRDYRFFVSDENRGEIYGEDAIVINGAHGYAEGLALLLEALGCKDLPDVYVFNGLLTDAKAEEIVNGVFASLAARINEILADPINEVLNLLPNLVYFLNTNGVAAVVDNLTAALMNVAGALEGFGIKLDLNELVNIEELLKIEKDLKISLDNLSLEAILELVSELTGLKLADLEEVLVPFAIGKVEKYDSVSASDAYKMVFTAESDKHDMITVLVTAILTVATDKYNAEVIKGFLGESAELYDSILAILSGAEVKYVNADWDYCWDENGEATGDTIPVIESALTYPNDWNKEAVDYLADNLGTLVDEVVKMIKINDVNYESLSALLTANVNVFNADTLNSLVKAITDLLGGIDAGLVEAAGILLDVNLVGLNEYAAPADVDTVDEFAAELANILTTYAKGVVEWLLLGESYTFFVNDKNADGKYDKGEDIITINGAEGYAKGLALLLEALGCKKLPTTGTTEEIVSGVLASLAARINEIFANPVDEVVNLLPNLLYFLNANGVAVVVDNLTASITALLEQLKGFGLNVDINELVNIEELLKIEKDLKISLDNLTIEAILELVSELTGLDLTVLDSVLSGFALGKIEKYDSVSGFDTYKMVYSDDFDKHHMITVLLTSVLLTVNNKDNVAVLNEMLGSEIVTAIYNVFNNEVEIEYGKINWTYPLADNGTVDAMKYSITYPNNWSKATATYVIDVLESAEFSALVAGLIDSNYSSLSDLLNAKVNVFTADTLNSLVKLIADLLGGIDEGLVKAAGLLLDADVAGLKAYTAPADVDTVEEFAAELANILTTHAKGVVEWLLLGDDYRFFVKDVDEDGLPVDFIVIKGANGYSEGLALLLEALGVDAPAVIVKNDVVDTEATVKAVLAAVAARINEIFANPVVEVLNLLPNILYFLNTDGVAVVIDNTLAAVTALLDKLAGFGLNVDINSLVNLPKLMGIADKYADGDDVISLDNITISSLLTAVGYMIDGLDLTHIEEILVGFALGEVKEYDSVSANAAYKMTYKDEFDKHDMITVLANIVLITLVDENNAAFVKGLVGEDIYKVILNLLDYSEAKIQEFDWQMTDRVGQTFSTIGSTTSYKGWPLYGPFYTEEMAMYIADNFGMFVNNIIYLLGLEIIEGQEVNTLEDLINDLLGGSVYNSGIVITIRDALAGVLAGIADLKVNNVVVGGYIAEVLAKAGIADINAVAKIEVPEFSDNKAMFVEYLCKVLQPLSGILKFVLADEDISFFVDLEKDNLITLKGAEGYAYGIIPLLEVLGCCMTYEEAVEKRAAIAKKKGVAVEEVELPAYILTPAEYYAAVEANETALLGKIIDPLLARVDEIVAAPADEVLGMLPNLIYFINSNGLDTVVKNTLNAVYSLLGAIEPIAKIDIYALIGVDLATINFKWLVEKLFALLEKAGYKFDITDINAIAELTVGTLEKYRSKNDLDAYRMVYSNAGLDGVLTAGGKAELVTVILRLIVTFLMHKQNATVITNLLKDSLGMSPEAAEYVKGVLEAIGKVPTTTYLGMNQAQAVIYYLFYGLDIGSDSLAGGIKDINAEWQNIMKELSYSDDPNADTIGSILGDLMKEYTDDVINPDGVVAPNGFIAFFQKIADWFNSIIEWFKNLFK